MSPPMVRRAAYRDFLQPTLQRRFASTAVILLVLAYLESVFLSSWSSLFWSWFPIGTAGIRAFTIFCCGFIVTVLRIAHPHIGIRTSNSSFDTFRKNALSLVAFETIFTYALSAFMFGQVYLISMGDKTGLQWITYHSGDRARLNEKALFFTVHMTLFGVFEGLAHMYLDYDRLTLGCVTGKTEEEAKTTSTKTNDPYQRLISDFPRLLARSVTCALWVACGNYLVFYSFVRRFAWVWAMSTFRWIYNLPKTNIPPKYGPWSLSMLIRSILAGIMLSLLWNFSNAALTYRLAQEPIKNGKPLTAESKDPNGSLLSGLKNKKPKNSAFAIWELALIARDVDVRRTAIFEDIDRPDGSMWSQVYMLCLNTIKELEQRIDSYGKPPPAPPFPQEPTRPAQTQVRVVDAPINADVWLKPQPPKTFRDSLGKTISDIAQTKGARPSEVMIPIAKQTAADIRDRLLSQQQQEQLSRESIMGNAHSLALYLMKVPVVGELFQQVYSNRLAIAVLGSPYGEVSVYVNAAFALSQLAVKSLQEDKYGVVSRDVPAIIRSLTTVVKKLEVFSENLPIHWTDLSGNKRCEPVEIVMGALKDALKRVVDGFEVYQHDLKLSRADIRLAKEAATKTIRAEPGKQTQQPGQQDVVASGQGRQPEMRQTS